MAPSNTIIKLESPEMNNSTRQMMLLRLPPEILGKIFLLTTLKTRTKIIASVCKSLNYFIFNHDILWSKLNLNTLANISDETIPQMFYTHLPEETKIYIRELYLNDVKITTKGLKVVLNACPNLKSLHLRTCKDHLEMSSVKNVIEEMFGPEEVLDEEISDLQLIIEATRYPITDTDDTTNIEIPTPKLRPSHPLQLQTIYWYCDHDLWIWWKPSDKNDLETLLQKLTNNPKATIQVPWCDFCNKRPANAQVACFGDSHGKNRDNYWYVYGCFECTDYCEIQAFKCDDCVKFDLAEKKAADAADAAAPAAATSETNSDTDENWETNSDGETFLELNEQQRQQNDIIVQIQIIAAGDENAPANVVVNDTTDDGNGNDGDETAVINAQINSGDDVLIPADANDDGNASTRTEADDDENVLIHTEDDGDNQSVSTTDRDEIHEGNDGDILLEGSVDDID
ncbi:chondroitin sulfate proteoglycan 4-like [Gigaspora margarita]|uniref:Chondroitin sulfate proteoglycan 4-like n=1 Tax=Gigaspora margarita TaxID=4874 RepID=A0A8H4AN76_GIGMA|nr:chondroitin sulfate proteoglycan 4-like [Gigaspora margarita]